MIAFSHERLNQHRRNFIQIRIQFGIHFNPVIEPVRKPQLFQLQIPFQQCDFFLDPG